MHNFHIDPDILESRRDCYEAIETIINNPAFITNYLAPEQGQLRNLVAILEKMIISDERLDRNR